MLDNLTPHEALVIARKRREFDQATAARKCKLGLHDYLAIEKGRLVPTPATNEGAAIAARIESEFGIPAAAWAGHDHQPEAVAS